jgi:hypothetical protein
MSYNANIPQATNIISSSQGQLLTNFSQLNTIFDVDHVTFDATSNNGQHQQITFNQNNVPGSAPVDPNSVIYTQAGTASSNAQVMWQNASSPFQLCPIKAWGTFAGPSPAVVPAQSFNISSIVRFNAGRWVVTISPNSVIKTSPAGNPYAVIVTTSLSNSFEGANFNINYIGVNNITYTGPGGLYAEFQINCWTPLNGGSGYDPPYISFIVLQI